MRDHCRIKGFRADALREPPAAGASRTQTVRAAASPLGTPGQENAFANVSQRTFFWVLTLEGAGPLEPRYQENAFANISRRTFFCTLPIALRGRSSMKATRLGTL